MLNFFVIYGHKPLKSDTEITKKMSFLLNYFELIYFKFIFRVYYPETKFFIQLLICPKTSCACKHGLVPKDT